jgi:F0F1-type ATP synthase membrane subunit b/b'
MGLLDNAKDAAEATGKKVSEMADDAKEHVSDKADEAKAESEVKHAEANRDATKAKNDYKKNLRDS